MKIALVIGFFMAIHALRDMKDGTSQTEISTGLKKIPIPPDRASYMGIGTGCSAAGVEEKIALRQTFSPLKKELSKCFEWMENYGEGSIAAKCMQKEFSKLHGPKYSTDVSVFYGFRASESNATYGFAGHADCEIDLEWYFHNMEGYKHLEYPVLGVSFYIYRNASIV
mmetsp:Transcript_20843/g.34326  ORF Transcript_20843/g.34326 Transcript_20843/m.34326 type:complete len:168 (+) Transcript_20843:73-576(+)